MTKHFELLLTGLTIEEDGSYGDHVFLRVIGKDYLPISFRIAAEADSQAKFYSNDFNLDYSKAKA